MVRGDLSRCQRQQIQLPRCSSCGKQFTNILRHFNHPHSKCAGWFYAATPLPNPSSQNHKYATEEPVDSPILDDFLDTQQPPPSHDQPHKRRVGFPSAAKTYSRTKTFMDRFNDDQYSGFRTTNVYYPFAGKSEWELGSFLLSSGLSMKKIDNFLWLNIVIIQLKFGCSILTQVDRCRRLVSHFLRRRPYAAE